MFPRIVQPSIRELAIQTAAGFENLVVLGCAVCSAGRGASLGLAEISFGVAVRSGCRMVGTRRGCVFLDFPQVQPGAKRCKTDRRFLYRAGNAGFFCDSLHSWGVRPKCTCDNIDSARSIC